MPIVYEERLLTMSSGPIEFLSDEPVKDIYSTEFGGDAGLIQPEQKSGIDPGVVGHSLTSGEIRGAVVRIGDAPLPVESQKSGTVEEDTLIDPVSGREVDKGDVKDVSDDGGDLTTLKPN